MALVELLGAKVASKNGEVDVATISADNDVVGIYFSAHWCPPCRMFTPALGDYYNKLRSSGKKFEIVFVSSDRDEGAAAEYFGSMPWLMVPFADRQRKDTLASKYSVSGIPTLVLVKAKSAETVTKEGRKTVSEDPEGEFCKP
ncbi:nucleoredoxin-like [Plakobranchus ocellatus]|uniref:Nucleoredoxin-like n=1 Tax=Plakobranchus ocellatus TaxID=259542 RepID=A0AAV3ZK20_9GAST|nr:nucleoredoxin-like [Plakobranchus ocellatus]